MKWTIKFFALTLSLIAHTKTFKISTQAPTGTTWAKNLAVMTSEVSHQTKGRVQFKIYYGGVSGDEPDVLRKIRIGQLHGAMFTGRTLGHIHRDTRIIELPFAFKRNRAKASKFLQEFTPSFNRSIETRGFKNLGFFEIGEVYLVTTKKAESVQQLKGFRTWTWEGDEIASLLAQEMQLVPVPLSLPDVLTALSTGMIDAAYASAMGILALQWNSKVKYLVDFPVAYTFGGLLILLPEWNKVSTRDRTLVEKIVSTSLQKNTADTVQENRQALQALRSVGVKFVQFPASDYAKMDEVSSNILEKLQAKKILSPEIASRYKELNRQ